MSYEFLFAAFSFLLGSWLVLIVRNIRQNRRVNSLEAILRLKELDPHNTFAAGLARLGKTASSTGGVLAQFPSVEPDDYADKDEDGVPDAFQNRKPLSEMLEFDKENAEPGDPTVPGRHSFANETQNEYSIVIELPARPPRKGEYFIVHGQIEQSSMNYSDAYKAIIIKQTRGCRPEDLVELSK